MNARLSQLDQDLLDAYVDGRLDAAARGAFEARLAAEAPLRAELDRQGQVDASLRRLFVAPAAPAIEALRPQPIKLAARARWLSWRPLATAAALLLMVWGGWWQWRQMTDAPDAPLPKQTVFENYVAEVAAGFKPRGECWEDKQFALVFYDKLSLALTVQPPPEEVKLLGIGYSNTLSPQTTMLLAVVNGHNVIAYVDRKQRDPNLSTAPSDCGDLHVFRRELDEVVIYEISPLDRPHLLDLFKQIEMKPEWYEEWRKSGRPY